MKISLFGGSLFNNSGGFNFGGNNYNYNNVSIIDENNFIKIVYFGNDAYNINVKKNESKILMTCNLKNDVISLYDYSLELSYEEFYKLGKSFRQCNDINEIFELLKNVMSDISISYKELKQNSYAKLNLLNNELELFLSIPLLTGQNEEITFRFGKKSRDTLQQFEKLKDKYNSLLSQINYRNSKYNLLSEDEKEFINGLIKILEKL